MESPQRSEAEDGGSGEEKVVETAEKIILRWDSTVSEEARDKMIFSGDRHEVDRYLRAVDEIQRSLHSLAISSPSSTVGAGDRNPNTIQIAMARLEDEFRNILLSHSSAVDSDSLLVDTPRSHSQSSSRDHFDSFSTAAAAEVEEEEVDKEVEREILRFDSGHGGGSSSGGERGGSTSSSRRSIRSTTSIREVDLIPSDAIADLRSIAERMIAAGYLRECIQVYGSVRKSSVDASFRSLGIEKLSIGDIQRLEWDALENKIRRWIKAAKVCIRTLFASEKRLSEQIFESLNSSTVTAPCSSPASSSSYSEACFLETVKGPAMQLFNFAEAISISRRSPEKLFKILDLHDALAELLPDIDVVFESKTAESIRVQAAEILSRLAEAARGILSEFENAVLREPSRVPVPGGTIHPLTRYVMNYISLISDYKQTLIELIVSRPSSSVSRYPGELSVPEFDFSELEEERTPLALHLIWIIVILEFNLEGKSQHYRDTSLAHLFMMNNVHYIVQKIKGSPELRALIGDEYLKKLTGKFRLAATSYQRATWVKVLHCLRDEGLHVSGSFSSGVSKSVLRERFKSFNAIFDEVHRTQATWLVPDTQLREELRISIAEKLLPAYRSFLGRFRSHIESGRHPEQYIKFSWEDLDSAVLDLFEGNPVTQHLRKRSQG
ncbi:exocyst complex component EXO70A1-like [Chenopodium quinoa]|uniref:exocyst complex component EXO70A1-like n=1 Tax=Chenopodium quinoa TaxID=63459 RepID=UPI000B7780A2|nr:exocyst complex component EXO70A1-like [Chenopodium quinoa]